MFEMQLNSGNMEKKLKEFAKRYPEALKESLEVAAIQFLTWANNGSSKESRKPPIRRAFLRGSGSTFVGSKLVAVAPGYDNSEANKSHSAGKFDVTWGWNAEYSTKMHETEYNLGEHSARDGASGNKWLEKHLDADRELFMAVVTNEFGTRTGMR